MQEVKGGRELRPRVVQVVARVEGVRRDWTSVFPYLLPFIQFSFHRFRVTWILTFCLLHCVAHMYFRPPFFALAHVVCIQGCITSAFINSFVKFDLPFSNFTVSHPSKWHMREIEMVSLHQWIKYMLLVLQGLSFC